uniref:Uncharacterized protein n=1 Tax=Arundo donax TaxID=35708 RepID=A0A0A8YXI1_ARUDO
MLQCRFASRGGFLRLDLVASWYSRCWSSSLVSWIHSRTRRSCEVRAA